MKELFKQREEFNKAFQIKSLNRFGLIPSNQYNLEFKMIQEELNEYLQACKDKDLIEVADAIGDMLYLVIGTAYKHGLDCNTLSKVMNEIHRSNMSKLHNGKVIKYDNGKVMKPVTYSAPNLKFVKDENR